MRVFKAATVWRESADPRDQHMHAEMPNGTSACRKVSRGRWRDDGRTIEVREGAQVSARPTTFCSGCYSRTTRR